MVKLANQPLGPDPALLLMQRGNFLFSLDLSARECDGHIIADVFSVHLSVEEAVCSTGFSRQPAAAAASPVDLLAAS